MPCPFGDIPLLAAGGGLSPLFLLITYLPYQSLSSMFFRVFLTHLLSNAPAILFTATSGIEPESLKKTIECNVYLNRLPLYYVAKFT